MLYIGAVHISMSVGHENLGHRDLEYWANIAVLLKVMPIMLICK
jgi:hypothetical protein